MFGSRTCILTSFTFYLPDTLVILKLPKIEAVYTGIDFHPSDAETLGNFSATEGF